MEYLFYDLEYATQKGGSSKICEFGYVVTNENFSVLDRGNLIINPNITRANWDYFAVKKILTRKIREYESKQTFPHYFDKIKRLFERADYVFGHSLDSDANSLNDELKRYNLPSIDHIFYDVKLFYKAFNNYKNDTSVIKILEELNIKGEENAHDAEADAFNTMLELKEMLNKLNVSVVELIELCPEVKNKTEAYIIESIKIKQIKRKQRREIEKTGDGSNSIKKNILSKKRLLQFLDNVKPTKEGTNKFKDKKITISINYEEHHYRQLLNIIQMIVNEGGTYILKASLADIFVKYDLLNESHSVQACSKLKYVEEANESGSSIVIIDFQDLLKQLEICEEKLDAMIHPSFDFLDNENAIIKDKRN
jgi:hypothetical protein